MRGDGGEAKVATGRRSRDWMPPFCGHMTNLGKIKGRWGRGVIIEKKMLGEHAKQQEGEEKRGRGVSAVSGEDLQSSMEM